MARRRKRKQDTEVEVQAETGAPDERPRLTPIDIQQKVFRLAFRGYNERDVDEFLDLVTESVATLHEENKRLREQVRDGGGSAEAVTDAEGQAETIVREAREHAAHLIEEADRKAITLREAPVAGISASFLIREREFLQRMAALVQSHAKGLKEEARKARAAAPSREPEEAVSDAESGRTEDEGAPSSFSAPEPRPGSPDAVEPPGQPAQAASAPSASGEATAPWGPAAEEEGELIGDAPPAAWAEAQPESQDPLLSAWESAFLAGPQDPEVEGSSSEPSIGSRPRAGRKDDEKEKENEPSLRELFWGEE